MADSGPTLSNLSNETRSFPPSAEFAAQANATEDWYSRGDEDREAFWAEQADRLTWSQKWERVLDWDGYVRLAFDEIRLAAGGYPQVTRRLEAALDDLKTVAPVERQAALDRQLRLLERGVERSLDEEDDRRAALVADQQGIGSGADVAIR